MKPLGLALRLVHLLSTLVPRWRRRDWTREWEAELHAHAEEADGNEESVLAQSTGAVTDAIFLRSQAMYWDLWWGDLRFAWKNAVRRPGFTLLVTATLALGIGVNSAVFALLDGVLLRPLPYRDPSRLVFVWQTLPRLNVFEVENSPFDYAAWHEARSLSEVTMISYGSYTLIGGDNPERVRGSRVTASLMPMLGISPAIGRAFTAAEDLDQSSAVAILGEGLWRRRYGADPAILGRSIDVDGSLRTVVGVMPRGAALPGSRADDELWLPMRMSPSERVNEIGHNYTVLARLADGVTLAQASAELEGFAVRMAAERSSHQSLGVRLVPVVEQTVHGIRPALVVAAASVALLLLVATANASTLLLARASNRRHELAVRAALGATAGRLRSLAMAEGLVLASLGALSGLILGSWTLRALLPMFDGSLPRSLSIDVDGRAALFTAALAGAIGIVLGAVAAYRPGRRLADALVSSTRSTASPAAARGRSALVVAQIALAVLLLSAAGLLISSVAKLSRVRPGFDPDRVLTFKVALTGPRYASAPARTGFISDLVDRLAATAGVRAAGVTSLIPFSGMRGANGVEIEGRALTNGLAIVVDQRHVSPGYFQAMRIPLVSGRALTEADDSRTERVTVINRTMAQRYFPNESPLNRRVRTVAGFDSEVWFRIIGVVDDVRHLSLTRDPVPEMYHPIAQTAVPTFTVVMRTTGEPSAMAPSARAVVQDADPNVPIYDVLTMDDRIASSFAQTRATMLLLLATSALAAALAGVAIYGSIWYSVDQRLPEIGIRLALGATRASVFAGILRRAMALALLGVSVGIASSMATGRLLAGMLFDTRATDPPTYGVVVAAVMALTIAASLVPARRAMRVDPMIALRNA